MNEHAWLVQRFEAVRTPPPSPDPSRLVCGPRGHEEGDRRGSNPRPPLEPQSADSCFWALLDVAESAYLRRFPCWGLPVVSGCCALSGVKVVSAPPSWAVPPGAW